MNEIDDAVGPHAGRAHELPEGGPLEPNEQRFQAKRELRLTANNGDR